MTFGISSTLFRSSVDLEQIFNLCWCQVLTTTSVIASSARPLPSVNAVDVLFDLIGSLIPLRPRNGARSVPEEPIPLGEVVCARHWNRFSFPEDERGPIYIYKN